MNASTREVSGLYPWTKDLEGSIDVRAREKAAFAMLLGWLDKFLCSNGLRPGKGACDRFWKESIKAKLRESWQLEQWAAAIRWSRKRHSPTRWARIRLRLTRSMEQGGGG